jgi:hypothetical protein
MKKYDMHCISFIVHNLTFGASAELYKCMYYISLHFFLYILSLKIIIATGSSP